MRWLLFVPVLLAGCRGATRPPLPDDFGTPIATGVGPSEGDFEGWDHGHVAWSPDAREVFFFQPESGTLTAIRAVDIETAATREVTGGLGVAGMLRVSPVGGSLYFGTHVDPVQNPGEPTGLFRVALDGGTPEHVVDDAWSGGYVLSPDGAQVAFSNGGFYDLGLGTHEDIGFDGRPLRFAPDGSQLVIAYGGDLFFFDVDTRASTPWAEVNPYFSAGLVWEPDRVELVEIDPIPEASPDADDDPGFRLVVLDGDGGTRAVTADGDLPYSQLTTAALSPDGSQAAVWFRGWCLEPSASGVACDTYQFVLVLVDVASGATRTIGALQTGSHATPYPFEPWTMAFSPDGSHLVFAWEDALYLKAVP